MTISLAEFRSLRWSAGGLPATRAVSQPIGAVLAWAACRVGLTPSQVTLVGTVVFLVGAASYGVLPQGAVPTALIFILLQLGYALDCADGQLARATARTSKFGAWLDVACDYVRNVAVATAITYWLIRAGTTVPAALLISALLLAGLVVQLHTATFLARASTPQAAPAEKATLGYAAVTLFIDTPTQLALLGALRAAPTLLALYAVAAGALYLALAWFLVARRVKG